MRTSKDVDPSVPSTAMPLWFRAFVAGLFAVLLVGYLLVRGAGGDVAFARSVGDLLGAAEPALRYERSRDDRRALPAQGSYRFNGMLVRYSTYPEADPAKKLGELERTFRKAGFRTVRQPVDGSDSVVALHPKTKVMLTAAVARYKGGYGAVRLAQRNLGELKADFVGEIAGVPRLPGAVGATIISSVEGPPVDTLTYVTTDSKDWVEQFYVREMSGRGWQPLAQPIQLQSNALATLFFAKGDQECSVLILAAPGGGGRIVMVTRDTPGRKS